MKLMQKLFGLLFFNVYSMQYKYSNLHEIYLVFLLYCSLINALASEVKCLRVIERRDLSNERKLVFT